MLGKKNNEIETRLLYYYYWYTWQFDRFHYRNEKIPIEFYEWVYLLQEKTVLLVFAGSSKT